MKFKVNSKQLLKALSQVSGTIKPNNTLPILDCFKMELEGDLLTITTSDLEVTTIVRIEVYGESNGGTAIPNNTFLNLFRTFDNEEVSIEVVGGTLFIYAEKGKYELPCEDVNEYPNTPVSDYKDEGVYLNGEDLKTAISKALVTTSNDELRPQMCGVYFDNTSVVSTDAHKLTDVKLSTGLNFLLPKKACIALRNNLYSEKVTVKNNETNAMFTIGNLTVITLLINSAFPNYRAVIPTQFNSNITLNKIDFINSLKRASIFSNSTTNRVELNLSKEECTLSADNIDFNNKAVETINGIYNGEPMRIGYNSKFLLDLLNANDDENVNLKLISPERATVIESENMLQLIMPIML